MEARAGSGSGSGSVGPPGSSPAKKAGDGGAPEGGGGGGGGRGYLSIQSMIEPIIGNLQVRGRGICQVWGGGKSVELRRTTMRAHRCVSVAQSLDWPR